MKKLIAIAAMLMATQASAAIAPVEEPTAKPDFTSAWQTAEEGIKADLYDPEGARIKWKSGFYWTSWKQGNLGMLNKRRWGWVSCGTINGKNRLGGYAGEKEIAVTVLADGQVNYGMSYDFDGICSSYDDIPSEALARAPKTVSTTSGMADELLKLADLRAKGILSQSEFEAQKARLLE